MPWQDPPSAGFGNSSVPSLLLGDPRRICAGHASRTTWWLSGRMELISLIIIMWKQSYIKWIEIAYYKHQCIKRFGMYNYELFLNSCFKDTLFRIFSFSADQDTLMMKIERSKTGCLSSSFIFIVRRRRGTFTRNRLPLPSIMLPWQARTSHTTALILRSR